MIPYKLTYSPPQPEGGASFSTIGVNQINGLRRFSDKITPPPVRKAPVDDGPVSRFPPVSVASILTAPQGRFGESPIRTGENLSEISEKGGRKRVGFSDGKIDTLLSTFS
jgi:hypothetical protein